MRYLSNKTDWIKFLCLLTFSLIFILLDIYSVQFKPIRTAADSLVYPLRVISSKAKHFYQDLQIYNLSKQQLLVENATLKVELDKSAARLQQIYSLQEEVQKLSDLLSLKNKQKHNLLLCNVLKLYQSSLSKQILIEVDKGKVILDGQLVLAPAGVVGLVDRASKLSEVLLLTDASYSLPVALLGKDISGTIIWSLQEDNLILQHVMDTTDIVVGDKVVTKDLGTGLPEGYLVGQVIKVEHELKQNFANVVIQPAFDFKRINELDRVFVVQN